MGTESLSGKEERNSPEYLAQLLKDKKQIQAFPNVFLHAERLIDEEINKVRVSLFHLSTNNEPVNLPDGEGPSVTLSEKVFVPVKDYPDFNFVGRILGPRGMTAKQLEQDTGCKIMVRGKGSMRDKKKEEQNRGKPNWEHLSEDLHVLITVEDTENRAQLKLKRAMDEVQKLLVPAPEGEDELKKMQLMELAIINGTYRDGNPPKSAFALNPSTLSLYQRQWEAMNDQPGLRRAMSSLNQGSCGLTFQYSEPRLLTPAMTQHLHQLRSPTSPAGAPLIIAPRLPLTPSSQQSLMSGGPPPLMSPQDTDFVYPYPYPYGLATPTTAHLLTDYSAAQLAAEQSAVGTSYVR